MSEPDYNQELDVNHPLRTVEPSIDPPIPTDKNAQVEILKNRVYQQIAHSKEFLHNNIQESLQLANKANSLAKDSGIPLLIAFALVNEGNIRLHMGQYDIALDYAFQALQTFEKLNFEFGVAEAKLVLGCVNLQLAEADQALAYLEQSLEIYKRLGENEWITTVHFHIGQVHFYMRSYLEALTYFEQVLLNHEKFENKTGISEVLQSIGKTYHALGDTESGIEWLKKSLNLARETTYTSIEITGLINLGEMYCAVNRNYKAIDSLLDSVELAKEKGEKSSLWRAYFALATAYKKVENFEKALTCYEQYYLIKEELFGYEAERKVKSVVLNHAIERAKRQVEIEAAQKKIKQLEEIVTMCAWSGKINLNGNWVKIEDFLFQRFGIRVSHGISEEEYEKISKSLQEEYDKEDIQN